MATPVIYPVTGFEDIGGYTGSTVSPVDSALSSVLGGIWSQATGTVDPWSKAVLVGQQTDAVVAAGGDPALAAQQAQQDVTNVLVANKADPSQASISNNIGLQNVKVIAEVALAVIVIYLGAQLYIASKQ